MVSRLTKFKAPAKEFNEMNSGLTFRNRRRLSINGPEFNCNERCLNCTSYHSCHWIDGMDCLENQMSHWFGHLDIGVIID